MARKTTGGDAAAQTSSTGGERHGVEVRGIRIRALNNRRCRLGFCFSPEGQVFKEDDLTEEQLRAFMADALLKVEEATFLDTSKEGDA